MRAKRSAKERLLLMLQLTADHEVPMVCFFPPEVHLQTLKVRRCRRKTSSAWSHLRILVEALPRSDCTMGMSVELVLIALLMEQDLAHWGRCHDFYKKASWGWFCRQSGSSIPPEFMFCVFFSRNFLDLLQ